MLKTWAALKSPEIYKFYLVLRGTEIHEKFGVIWQWKQFVQ